MADQAKNVLIGLFVVAACAIGVFILLFLHPSVGNEGRTLRVRFNNIDKVNVGTRVNFAGMPVGEVVEIRDIENPNDPREGHEGFVYPYELVLKVDTKVNVYNTDLIFLRTSGLLGEKSVAILPYPQKKGEKLELVDNQILYATETGSIEDTLSEFKGLSDKIEAALDGIILISKDITDSKVVQKISHTLQNLDDISSSFNKPEKIEAMLNNLHQMTENGVSLTKKFSKTLDKLDVMAANLVDFSKESVQVGQRFSSVMEKVGAGEGTVGRLLMKDDLYLQTVSIINKVETLADDINHYGLLFNLDKDWQKLRARRANLLMELSSPQQFRNFFNDEIDSITTSLGRVSRVMEETESLDPCGELGEDKNFIKVFAELLRRVNALEKNLEMYNQQLMEVQVYQTEFTPCPAYCE